MNWAHGFGMACLVPLASLILGCGGQEPPGPVYGVSPFRAATDTYTLAIHPLYNPTKLFQAYHPLIDYLNAHLDGGRLELQASRDYTAFEEKYAKREPAFLLPNPWQTLQAIERGYRVIAIAGDPKDFRGLFLVRKDRELRSIRDLKGGVVAYPAPTALAACILLQDLLLRNGVNPVADVESRFVGSQESSIMTVYLGTALAGGTWPPPWREFQRDHPAEAKNLRIGWETESLVNNSVMVRDDVPPTLANEIQALLVGLDSSEAGREILAGMETERFLKGDNASYAPVRVFLDRFESQVRRIP